MIKYVCSDCGDKFHTTGSYLLHECTIGRCDGDCGHACSPDEGMPCDRCESLNPDLVCWDCLSELADGPVSEVCS